MLIKVRGSGLFLLNLYDRSNIDMILQVLSYHAYENLKEKLDSIHNNNIAILFFSQQNIIISLHTDY